MADTADWVGPEALRHLSRAAVSADTVSAPAWATQQIPFDLSVGIGLSSAELLQVACGAPTASALALMARFGGIRFATIETDLDPAIRHVLQRVFTGLFPFPVSVGEMQHALEGLFACMVSHLEARQRFAHLTVRVRRRVPPVLAHLAADDSPVERLFLYYLNLSGMQVQRLSAGSETATSLPPVSLDIELYGGPWQIPSRKTGTSTLSFDPTLAEPLPSGSQQLRFVDARVSDEHRAALAAARVWLAVPLPNGDFLFQDHHGQRLIPDLPERPAGQRLIEILSERLSGER